MVHIRGNGYSLLEDLQIAKLMVNRLETYVRGEQIYGNQGMFVEGYPAITIGGLLMRIRRLNGLRDVLGNNHHPTLDEVISKHDKVYERWGAHYEEKLLAEVQSRVTRVQQFIKEYQANPKASIIAFAPEQMRRTIVHEALYMMQRIDLQQPQLLKHLAKLDADLKKMVERDVFCWDSVLRPVYAEDEFWWLYSKLKSE